jgi:hypothetical protein
MLSARQERIARLVGELRAANGGVGAADVARYATAKGFRVSAREVANVMQFIASGWVR